MSACVNCTEHSVQTSASHARLNAHIICFRYAESKRVCLNPLRRIKAIDFSTSSWIYVSQKKMLLKATSTSQGTTSWLENHSDWLTTKGLLLIRSFLPLSCAFSPLWRWRCQQLVGARSQSQQFEQLHECEHERERQQQQQREQHEWGLPRIL